MPGEDVFEKMAEDLIADAEGVDCPLSEFRDGLRTILDAVRERLSLVEDELGRTEG